MAVSGRAEGVEAEAGGLVRPVRHQHLRPLVSLHRQGRGLHQHSASVLNIELETLL